MYKLWFSYKFETQEEWVARDDKARKIVGKEADGSGTWLIPPMMRDIDWSFDTLEEAETAAAKLKEAFSQGRITIDLDSELAENDEDYKGPHYQEAWG
jgi:hypothetical protein